MFDYLGMACSNFDCTFMITVVHWPKRWWISPWW